MPPGCSGHGYTSEPESLCLQTMAASLLLHTVRHECELACFSHFYLDFTERKPKEAGHMKGMTL